MSLKTRNRRETSRRSQEDSHQNCETSRPGRERTRPERRNATPDWFNCCHCGQPIVPEAYGTEHRNHCPQCLWSKHLDDEPGDRESECHGGMEPIAVWARPGGDWAVIHRCRSCGVLHSNRIAGDDNELVLVALATRPIALPPFPLSRLTRWTE